MEIKHLVMEYDEFSPLCSKEQIAKVMNEQWDESSWEVRDDGMVYRTENASDGYPIIYNMVPENEFFIWMRDRAKENNNPIPTDMMIHEHISRNHFTISINGDEYILVNV